MKFQFLFLPLALLVAHISLAQSNPSSPNSQSAVAAVSASGVFISSYQENDQEDYYVPAWTNSPGYVFPSYTYSDYRFTHWTDGKGGNGAWQFHDDAAKLSIYSWPATSFPQALPYGTGVGSYPDFPEILPVTNTCNPPILAQEHCKFSLGKNMQRTAETKMKLSSGGAAGSTRMNLWVISATATAYSLPWVTGGGGGGGGGGWSSSLTGTPIASQNISIFGKALGNDGNLYVLLPDNTTPDATPVVVGGADYYSFTITAQKCKLRITANGYPLADDRVRPQAYYCVGQKLVFEGVFSPGPFGLNYTSPTWNYTADYINNHWTDANGCEEYNIAPIPAMSNPTPAWFYNKKTQDAMANLGFYCKFNNGQSVYLVRQGKFNVYTPSVAWSPSVLYGGFNVSEALLWLSLGTPSGNNDGAADFSADITSKFLGDIGITQMVNGSADFGFPDGGITTDGNLYFDGSVIYAKTQKTLLDRGYGFFERTTDLTDCPGCLVGNNYTSIHLKFNDYVRFCPSGSDSIWVTLGRADWGWDAEASYDSNGNAILPQNDATQPVFALSNQFPPPCSGVKDVISKTKDLFWYILFGAP